MATAWMVRAGRGGYIVEDLQANNVVAIGWEELGDLTKVKTREALRELVETTYPEKKPGQIRSAAGQVAAFLLDIQQGDPVVTYNTETRTYLIGEIASGYEFKQGLVSEHPHIRHVNWQGQVSRDDVSPESRNTLGAIQTLFKLGESVWAELSALKQGMKLEVQPVEVAEDLESIREDVLARGREFIKDRVQQLDWDDMQEFIAGILRAMGYRTTVSAAGPDRGKDIVASPDGLGLEQPRIRVEVKHRKAQMGAPDIRSFIGALRQNDRGLYVSTGGFTREAHYEAERATIPVTLLDLDALVTLMLQHYENLDTETRAMVPLVRVYWPAG